MLGVYRQPDANTVEVVDRVKAMLPAIQAELPPGVEIQLLADRSKPIRDAIDDVEFTLILAAVLVIIAIYFFLRSFRATLIPAIALPISIIGTFAGMYVCGHSIDNISLLALTLAVGFVVDDAIVMLENIVRHIEAGEKPMEAAFKGSKEVGFTIVSMTLSLVAVFIPVLFMGGVVGRMFNEFGLVISFAILISGIVSLTLTPMLCSRMLKPIDHHEKHNFLLRSFEWSFNKVSDGYAWALQAHRRPAAARARHHARHLRADRHPVPGDAQGLLPVRGYRPDHRLDGRPRRCLVRRHGGAPARAGRGHQARSRRGVGDVDGRRRQRRQHTVNSGRMFIMLRDKPERKDSAQQVIARLRRATATVPGINVFFQPVQSINIGTTQTPRAVPVRHALERPRRAARVRAADGSSACGAFPRILDVNSDLQVRARSTVIDIDRDIASRLGLSVDQIRLLLYSAFGIAPGLDDLRPRRHLSGDPRGRSEVRRRQRRAAPDCRSARRAAALVPLDTVAKRSDKPTSLTVNHIAQLPSVIDLVQPGARRGARPGGRATSRRRRPRSACRPTSPPASRAAPRSSSRRSPTRACCCSPPCW